MPVPPVPVRGSFLDGADPVSGEPPSEPAQRTGIHCRAEEWAVLQRFLDRPAPYGAVVVIDGDTGSGVSTLLAAACGAADRRGWAVFSGSPSGPGTTTALGAFYDAFGPTPLLEILQPFERLSGSSGADGDSPARRQELYRRVREEVTRLARGRTVLLALDDLHWFDPASVDLLVSLLRRPPAAPVLVALGCRTTRMPTRVERVLSGAQRIHLGPVGEADVRALYPTATARRRRALLGASAGSPRYLRMLGGEPTGSLAALAQLAGPETGGSGTGFPPPLADTAVIAELEALGPDARVVVGVAALMGEEIDPDAVAAIGGLAPGAVTAELDRLVALDVIRCAAGRLRFRHPLVSAAATRITGSGWRVAAHRRIDAWLSARSAPVAVRAPHVVAFAQQGDGEAAVVLAQAARVVLRASPGTAAQWLETSLRIRPPADGGSDVADRLLLAQAHLLSGHPDRAVEAAVALPAGPSPCGVEAALVIARALRVCGLHREAAAVLRAEARLASAVERIILETEGDAIDVAHGNLSPLLRTGAEEACRRASRAAAGPRVAAVAAVAHAASVLLAGGGALCTDATAEAERVVDALDDDDVDAILHHLPLLVGVLQHRGASTAANRLIEHASAVAVGRGRHETLPQLSIAAAVSAMERGRTSAASALAEDALDAAEDLGQPGAAATAAALRAVLTAWRDGPTAAFAVLAGRDLGTPDGSWLHAVGALAWAEVLLLADLPGQARDVCRMATHDESGSFVRPRLWALRARASVVLGDLSQAHDLVERAMHALCGAGVVGGVACSEVLLARALVASAHRDDAAARTAAAAAAAALGEPGSGLAAGRLALAAAEIEVRAGDLAAARALAETAVIRLEDAGVGWLAASAADMARRCTALGPGSVLSPRECEIARLVADGLTNRSIAGRLVLSVRTVDSHVARILAKLGVSSRGGVGRILGHPA